MRLMARNITLALGAVLVAIQFVPVPTTNPPSDPGAAFRVTRSAGDPAVGVLDRSCRDCHSNETVWPWYSRVAPASWLLYRDVHEGRRELNLSEFNTYNDKRKQKKLEEVCQQVRQGEMPPWFYLPLHPDARLQSSDVDTLCGLSSQPAAN